MQCYDSLLLHLLYLVIFSPYCCAALWFSITPPYSTFEELVQHCCALLWFSITPPTLPCNILRAVQVALCPALFGFEVFPVLYFTLFYYFLLWNVLFHAILLYGVVHCAVPCCASPNSNFSCGGNLTRDKQWNFPNVFYEDLFAPAPRGLSAPDPWFMGVKCNVDPEPGRLRGACAIHHAKPNTRQPRGRSHKARRFPNRIMQTIVVTFHPLRCYVPSIERNKSDVT